MLIDLARAQPRFKTRARLDILEAAVRAAPSLDGILIADALDLLERELGERIPLSTLVYALQRWEPRHELTLREGRVRLHGAVLAEVLAQQHLARRAARLAEEPVLVEAD